MYKRLNIKAKGDINKTLFNLRARVHAVLTGVKTTDISHSLKQVSFEVVGEPEKLWKTVAWSKRSKFLFIVHEVVFQFTDC